MSSPQLSTNLSGAATSSEQVDERSSVARISSTSPQVGRVDASTLLSVDANSRKPRSSISALVKSAESTGNGESPRSNNDACAYKPVKYSASYKRAIQHVNVKAAVQRRNEEIELSQSSLHSLGVLNDSSRTRSKSFEGYVCVDWPPY